MNQTQKKMVQWSIVSAAAITLFWGIWFLVNGEVPSVKTMGITPDWTTQLPFSISRWWDVLIGPIWSVAIIPVWEKIRNRSNSDLIHRLIIGIMIGLVIGLVDGLVAGLSFGFITGIFIELISGLSVILRKTAQLIWKKMDASSSDI